ncbi:MAG: ABC transporter ATP-binding protein/permease [Coriobacteriia bacterium]|nr:ABC transporter ATP-binding protein/permease [Coriobacteriia bacterium]
MVKLFLRYLKPYPVQLALIVVSTLALVGFQMYLPNLMSNIVDIGIVRKGVPADSDVVATYATQTAYLWQMGSRMLLVTLLTGIAATFAGFLCSRVSAGLARDLREAVFAAVSNFSLVEMNRFSTASLIIRSTNDIQQIQQVSFLLLRLALTSPIFIIVAFTLAFVENAQLSWIFAAVIPVFAVLFFLTVKYVMPIFRGIQKKTDHLNLIAREGLTGVRVIRAFNRQDFQQDRYRAANDDLTDANIRAYKIMIVLMPFAMFVIQITTIAIVWFGGHHIAAGELQLGSLMAFMQYVMWVLYSLIFLSMIMIMVPRASVSAERVMQVLDTLPAITDPIVCKSTKAEKEAEQVQHTKSHDTSLEFARVSFHFEGEDGTVSKVAALSDISFTARRGETLAIIGSTGSGKSTIMNLAMRLYDVTSGTILLDGVDLRDYRQKDLRQRIGYIPQKAVLFSGSVADNVRFGNPRASDEEVIAALKIAQAWDFISDLPQQLNAAVAQGGKNFSGGQRQRLAIARTILKAPEVYLFDDSFSALDLQTDARLRAALKPLLADSTMLIVAQRITTIQDATQIIVLEEGTICGRGTHDQLMAENTVYQEIAASQLTAEEVARHGSNKH